MSDDIRIVHETADGTLCVSQVGKGFTVEQAIEGLRRPGHPLRIPDGVTPLILPASEIPTDEKFRGARKIENGKVVICIHKANALAAAEAQRILDAEAKRAERITKAEAIAKAKPAATLAELKLR